MSSQQTINNFYSIPEDIIRFNEWVLENVQTYLRGRILEINSGGSQFSSLLIGQGIPIHLSDKDEKIRHVLRTQYYSHPAVRKVHNIDILKENFAEAYPDKIGRFSAVLCINIAQPAFPIELILENAGLLLRKGGILIVSLPSHIELFPGAVQEFQEIRDNNRKYIHELLAEFRILKTRYFNFDPGKDATEFLAPAGLSLFAVVQAN